ncbi:MAG: hypothetical protein JWQ08_616, partial [Deinococcus sp.]|nr:hypothetical protein [Deinococcus sp.]
DPVPPTVQERYAAEGASVLDLTGASRDLRGRVRSAALLQVGQARHDPAALATALLHLISRARNAA